MKKKNYIVLGLIVAAGAVALVFDMQILAMFAFASATAWAYTKSL